MSGEDETEYRQVGDQYYQPEHHPPRGLLGSGDTLCRYGPVIAGWQLGMFAVKATSIHPTQA